MVYPCGSPILGVHTILLVVNKQLEQKLTMDMLSEIIEMNGY